MGDETLAGGDVKGSTDHHKGPWLGPGGHMSEKIGGARLVFRVGHIPGQEVSQKGQGMRL